MNPETISLSLFTENPDNPSTASDEERGHQVTTKPQEPIKARIWPIIEVPFCDAIPSDYPGPMGVPQTFIDKYNPNEFLILDHIKPKCRGKDTFERIVIVNKRFLTSRFQVYKKPNGTYCTAEKLEKL